MGTAAGNLIMARPIPFGITVLAFIPGKSTGIWPKGPA